MQPASHTKALPHRDRSVPLACASATQPSCPLLEAALRHAGRRSLVGRGEGKGKRRRRLRGAHSSIDLMAALYRLRVDAHRSFSVEGPPQIVFPVFALQKAWKDVGHSAGCCSGLGSDAAAAGRRPLRLLQLMELKPLAVRCSGGTRREGTNGLHGFL
ncbi:hypothetical protein cyc_04578 [Cyclospora cayetanensis]|uniref:Uncharacterized protein n=1 Tax=Cyclospora cayetanensis TaxID=88456 RepID=A0A1D3CU07_9EIME|nr:hypothetical protein cyc_04578 [Cyclospora cayetanensis]